MWQASDELKEKMERLAQIELHIKTLETRNSDSLDFHELAVWSLRDALVAAYNLGLKEGWLAPEAPLVVHGQPRGGAKSKRKK